MRNVLSLKGPVLLSLLPIDKRYLNADQLYAIKVIRSVWTMCAAFCYLGYKYLPMTLPAMPSVAERLAFTIQWQLPGLTFMLIALFEVLYKRFRYDGLRNPLQEDANAE